MTITFSNIPDALRYPGAYIEIDGSQAGLGGDLPIVLLVGQKLATGNAPAGEIVRLSSVDDAILKAGAGSMLADMAKNYRAVDQVFDVYMLPYADNAAGVAATGTLTVTAQATVAGTLPLYIAGKLVSIGVSTADTPAQIATAIAAAVTAAGTALPVTAAVAGAIVTLTSRHKGSCGNEIDLRLALYGEHVPDSLAITIAGMAGGAGDPAPGDLSAILGNSRWYRYIALGINDTATLAAWHTESRARYLPPIQAGFRAFTAKRGGYAAIAAFGETKNYEHICCLSTEINPTPSWVAAAVLTAAAAPKLYNNPVISLEGTALPGVVGVSYHSWGNANSLLYKGISVMEVGNDGSCYIKRPISMYQRRSDNSADDAYLDINVSEVTERYRYEQRMAAIKAFRGTVAAKDNEGFRPGLRITTEDSVRALLLSQYKNVFMGQLGWVQGYDYYKSTLVVEQNATNPSRFDFRDDPVINSPFYIVAGINRFHKAVPATV